MRLYINKAHCLSIEQLREYFSDQIDVNSDIYWDLLDYGRNHDISKWLQEMGEEDLACQLEAIDYKLDDSAFFVEMCRVILGEEIQTFTKPDFSQCYNVENVLHEVTDVGATVFVCLKVLLPVNEMFELKVQTDWGIRAENINPFYSKTGEVVKKKFDFRKRPNRNFSGLKLFVDDNLLSQNLVNGCDKKEFTVNGVSFNMIRVEHGTFMMGATEEQKEPGDYDTSVCKVKLFKDYYIGETPVTQELWRSVMGNNPSDFWGANRPVEKVSWDDCQSFIRELNKNTGNNFRLPTMAEWEFAARGGNRSNHTKYSGGNNIKDVAWCFDNSNGHPHAVAKKHPNELGIYDMSGNVWEWCNDKIESTSKFVRMCKGGSWKSQACDCRLFKSFALAQFSNNFSFIGFRLCLPIS